MPNQQAQKNLHSENYYLSFPDGSFSKNFLDFSYPNEEHWTEERLVTEIRRKVYKFPEGLSPFYYQGKRTTADFNAYANTDEGKEAIKKLREELSICFEQLNAWAKEQKLEVSDERHTTQNADAALLEFYNRLINGDFSDRTILFYSDGKKSIETLTLLIQDASIDLAFRQNQLINLVAEGNLLLCADGCFSRFMAAADALKNFGDLSFSSLVKKFVLDLAEKAGRALFEDRVSHSVALCEELNISSAGNEIHAINYLINRLLAELGLFTLTIKDDFVRLFENNDPEIRQAIDSIYQEFQKNFKNDFRAGQLVQFIIEQYYQRENIHFFSGVFSSSKELDSKTLENFLKVMGEDSDFNLHEVLDFDEAGKILLKEETALVVTLTERLLNKGWFDLDQNGRLADKYRVLKETFNEFDIALSPQSERDQSIRIFNGNLALSWITDEEGNRMTLPYCLAKITNCLSLLKKKLSANMLKNLLENSDDFIDFFAQLPREEHKNALDWLVAKEFNLHTSMFSKLYLYIHLEPNNRLFWENYRLIKDFNKLFTTLSSDARTNFISRFNLHERTSELLSINIEQIRFIELQHFIPSILEFIQFVKGSGFRDFKNLIFDKVYTRSNGFYYENRYLDGFDFSNTNFKDTEFHTTVFIANFKGAALENLTFYNNMFRVNFKESKGDIDIFGDVSDTDFSRSHLIICIRGKIETSFFQELTGKVIILGDIKKIEASNLKGIFDLNGNAEETDLRNFVGEMKINGELDKVNLKNARGESLTLNGEIKNSNLHGIHFKNIQVTGEISNSYLTSIDFRQIDFIDPEDPNTDVIVNPDKVFKVKFKFNMQEDVRPFFQDSQFSTTSLIQFLNLPSMDRFAEGHQVFSLLRGTRLSEIDFLDEHLRTALKRFYFIDFSGAYLQSARFDHLLQDEIPYLYQLKFKNADLQRASFESANLANAILDGANLSHCDLSTADTTSISVKGAKIDNLQLRCDQLFHFFEEEHRDFSTLRLVGDLENVETFSLAGTKLSSQAFEHLVTQGFKNFKEVDLTAVSREIIRQYRNRDDFSFEKAMLPPEKRVLSLTDCLEESPRRKREIICLFDEDDIEEFSSKNEQSGESQINSERFIDKLKSAPEDQRVQLIEFASQYPVVGTKQVEVKKLFQLGKWQEHFTKVSQVSNLISKGVIAKKALISFLKGDYEDTAINLGFLGGSSLLGQFSKELEARGEAFLFEGKNLLGNGFKATSPFFKRGTSAFMVYDLVQAVKELNPKDSATLVRVVGDSIYIGVDVAEIGIEVAEVFEIFEGVSAITGPIGEVIGAVVFLGTDIYQAVQRVKQIDAMLHLTGSEKFREGVRAFLGMGIEDYLEELIEEKQFNEIAIKKVWDYLKQHPTIKNYIFPTQKQVCRKVRYKQADSYGGGLNGGGSRDGSYWRLTEVCDQTITDLDNQVFLDKIQKITWSRAKPEVPKSGDLLCFPPGTGGSSDRSYYCQNAIGISDSNHKAANYTLINVGEGVDRVRGFLTSANTIIANNGDKHLIGGNQNDSFILQGDVISGYIDGEGGVNTLDLGDFASNRGSLEINLSGLDPYIVHNGYGYKSIRVFNIQQVLARKEKPDHIHVGCNTTFVDGRGGYYDSYGQDVIVIGSNQCHYQMQIKVSPYTFIKNQANQGNFSYLVTQGNGHAELHFEPLGKDITQHQISFNYTLPEISKIQFLPDNKIIFNLMPETGNGFNVTLGRSNSTMISCIFTDQTEIKLGRQKTYTLQKTEKKPYEIAQQYPTIAEKLHGSMTVHSHNQTIVIGYPFHHDVLQNDPLHPSHLVGNGGENIYKIVLGGSKEIPKITLYPPQANSKKIETLDLRAVIKEMEAHNNYTTHLMIRKKGNNLHLLVTPKTNKNCKLSKKPSLRIILKDAAKTSWIHQLSIITHQSFLEIKNKSNRYAWILTPKPLIFGEAKKIIVLSAQDIEAHTHVMLPQAPGGLNFARIENSDDLVITSKRINQARTVLIKEFYSAQGLDAHKLLTLSLQFGNETVTLTDVASRSLPSLATLQNNKKERVYKSILGENISDQSIIKTTQSWGLLMGTGVSIAIAIGYFSIKHLRARQFRPARGDAATIALLATATLPAISAKPILPKAEMVVCHNQFLNDEQCAKSQTSIGTLIFCANNEIVLAWFKGEKGYDSAYAFSNSTKYDIFEPKAFGEDLLMARGADQCQQIISLKMMNEVLIGKMMALPVFQKLLEQPLEQYKRQNDPIERFQQQAQEIGLIYLSEQCLVHTTLGDAFRVLGLTPNWQQRDVGHWSNRVLRSLSARNLFSSGSISGVCLEVALLHPGVQSALPADKYRGKLVIRFIANLLQFGPSASSCIPSVFEFLFYQHPAWSYEKAMGLRGALALLEVINDPSTWYLAVGLFILPQIPNWLENIGIPVTRYISHALQMLEKFLISYSLMLSMQEDPQRLAAKEIALQEAEHRVAQGKVRASSVLSSISFFGKSKTSATETNDAEFSHGASTQFAAKN